MAMAIEENHLSSFHVLERSLNNQVLLTWSYPSIEDEHRKATLNNLEKHQMKYYYFFSNSEWIYVYEKDCKFEGLKSFAICVKGMELEPMKYKKFCTMFWSKYNLCKSGPQLVRMYLANFIFKSNIKENGNLTLSDFSSFKQETCIKDIIKSFGYDFILLYVSFLLKKRILFYHNDVSVLQKYLYSATKFVETVNPKEYLRPFVQNLDDIKAKMHFLAGITNLNSASNKTIYDILFDLTKYEIKVRSHVKEHFHLTDFHKKFAKHLCNMVNNEDVTEEALIIEINQKTSQLRAQLGSLTTITTSTGKKLLTLESLQEKNFNKNLENFLLNYAIVENMIII